MRLIRDSAAAEDSEETQVPEEPVEVLKTLDQYLSEVSTTKKVTEAPVRRANEGSDDSQWKNTVVLVKEEEDLFAGKVIDLLSYPAAKEHGCQEDQGKAFQDYA